MTSKEVHKQHIAEHVQEVDDALAIGLEQRSATIGLHASACSIELLELYLHSLGKISVGTVLKHDWFKAPKLGQKIKPLAERKLAVEFPYKEEIFSFLYVIEEQRNKLIYGKPHKETTAIVLKAFRTLHALIKSEMEKLGEEIA